MRKTARGGADFRARNKRVAHSPAPVEQANDPEPYFHVKLKAVSKVDIRECVNRDLDATAFEKNFRCRPFLHRENLHNFPSQAQSAGDAAGCFFH
jgi:hypothetical protein